MLLLPLALAAPAPLGWTAVSAEWTLHIRDEEPVRLSARYTLASSDAKAGQLTLVGPEVLVVDAPGPVVATPSGLGVALNPDRLRLEQRVEGIYLIDTPGALSVGILPAARTKVVVDAPGLDVTVSGAVDGWLTPTNRLTVTWAPHVDAEPTHVRAFIQGEAATTFRGDAGAIAVDSVLRWKVLRGESQRFTFDAAGLEELDVTGENIASWERTGETVTVRTQKPVKGLLTVVVRGRTSPAKGERVAPTPVPTAVNRVDRYVTMARSDEGELIPIAAPSSHALGALPSWARNLGEAAPLAAWHGAEPVRVLVATVGVLEGPGTVVTQARYTVAASRDGRAAVRMNLRVRNERRQYLHVVPPPDGTWRPVVIRVGNQPKSWLSDGKGGIYIPLERSVETVRGPLSFPVDAEWIADGVAWDRKGEQTLRLPSVDAPVQAATWEVHLPRGYARVGVSSGGQEGFALSDLRSEDVEAERKREEVVSSALQNAVSAYRQNDFSGAERWLQEAQNVDGDNEEVAQLQSNIDVLTGRSNNNDSAARRVRSLAKAKNEEVAEKQVALEKEAEDLLRSGNLDEAEARYSQALEIANTLQQTEQLESVEQKSKIAVAQQKLGEIANKRSSHSASFAMGKKKPDTGYDAGLADEQDGRYPEEPSPEPESPPVAYEGRTEIDFEGLDLAGELAQPDTAMTQDRKRADMAPMIQTRDSFDDQIEASTLEIADEDSGGFGISGMGISGTGEGGGGASEGLGGIGTLGSGSGSGYGSGGERREAQKVVVTAAEIVIREPARDQSKEEAKPAKADEGYYAEEEETIDAERSYSAAPMKKQEANKPAPSQAPASTTTAATTTRSASVMPVIVAPKAAAPPPPPPPPAPARGRATSAPAQTVKGSGRAGGVQGGVAGGVVGGALRGAAGAAANENAYVVDGAVASDPVTGTFSQNAGPQPEPSVAFGRDKAVEKDFGWAEAAPVEVPADANAPADAPATAVDIEQTASGTTLTTEFLARIPTGRSYQNAVGMTAGVVTSSEPEHLDLDNNRDYHDIDGKGRSGIARAAAGDDTWIPPEERPMFKAEQARAEAAKEREEAERGARQRVVLGRLRGEVEQLAARAADPFLAGTEAGEKARLVLQQASAALAEQDASIVPDLLPFFVQVSDQLDAAERTRPPPPRVIERREPIDASPSPMALAMPLDGPTVSTRQALLPGDTFPTWRVRYRRLPGEPE